MDYFATLISDFSSFLWNGPMIICLLFTHIFLTVRLRFPQRHIFKAIRLSIKKEEGSQGDVSAFGALATSLAATIGTGNIVGVGTAVALGGPGAVFWCWITGVLGIATKYAESMLAVKYRVKTSQQKMIGGPMFALSRGLGMKKMAILFCIFTALAAFGIGNTVQANAISTLLYESYAIDTWISGLAIASLVAAVLIFGVKGISNVCSLLVPIMALLYVCGCLYILFCNSEFIGQTLSLIISSAFDGKAAIGGAAGSGIMVAARYGIARGLFSNESGMGSAPIVAAAAKSNSPVNQGLISSSGTFWDTVVICAMTGLVLVSTQIANPDISAKEGAILTKRAFECIPVAGPLILSFGLMTFTFSTILGWSYYAERAIEYLFSGKWQKRSRLKYFISAYRITWVIAIFIGSIVSLQVVWDFADCMNALMALPNLLSLILLSKIIAKESDFNC